MSKEFGEMIVQECHAKSFKDCDIVFSGLDSDVAGDIGSPIALVFRFNH